MIAREAYNAQEVSVLYGVTERTVRRWISEDKLRAVKHGRGLEITVEDLQRMSEEHQIFPSAKKQRENATREENERLEQELHILRGRYEVVCELLDQANEKLKEELILNGQMRFELEQLKQSQSVAGTEISRQTPRDSGSA
jgi:excisionase family DNA binding protein